nr:PKD domain-containing protein [Bacteroidota bacterium]
VAAGGTYINGDAITVYYLYSVYAQCGTAHENVSEDPISMVNYFELDGVDQLAGGFDFADPPGPPGGNSLVLIGGSFTATVGVDFNTKLTSGLSVMIKDPNVADTASCYFHGTLQIQLDEQVQPELDDFLFSLDIGSDTEMSDPNADGDEVFDPGDAYLFWGTLLAAPTDGIWDDDNAFGWDPIPDPVGGGIAPCGSGQPIDQIVWEHFDLDGLDVMNADLRQYEFGPGIDPIDNIIDAYVFKPDRLWISFDDDDAPHFVEPAGSVPVNSFSPFTMSVFGMAPNNDEVVELTFNTAIPIPMPMTSYNPKYSEKDIHDNLAPNPGSDPDFPNKDDDDVDALDAPYELSSDNLWYISPDHEATCFDQFGNLLNGGNIYLAQGGQVHEVINYSTHLGLEYGVDVDAFEFTFLYYEPTNDTCFAMLFSVDDDDPLTTVDESGGLMPGAIYVSFLNGTYGYFSTNVLDEDIDAIAILKPGCVDPQADFIGDPLDICENDSVNFTDLSTGVPTNWSWSFPGGTPNVFVGQNPPSITYNTAGSYDVTLTVSNACGTDTKTIIGYVNVGEAPTADFTPKFRFIFGSTGTVTFTDNSTGSPTTWDWTFDGSPASHSGQTPPAITFSGYGRHNVELIVSNNCGSDTATGRVFCLGWHWHPVFTPITHLITIPFAINPNINGVPLCKDDLIGVFYTDLSGNKKCGGFTNWDPQGNGIIAAFGDDPTTPEKDGFDDGEDFMFMILSFCDDKEYDAIATFSPNFPNQGSFTDNGISVLETLEVKTCQKILLPAGWSGMSSYKVPVNPDMPTIMGQLGSNLTILYNMNGMYWPSQGINSIGDFDPAYGYIIKVTDDDTLNICGNNATNPAVSLAGGWGLIPVLSTDPVDVVTVMASLGTNFYLAKAVASNKVYWPYFGINTIGDLEPGKAYFVYLTGSATLTYPAGSVKSSAIQNFGMNENITPWNDVTETPNSHLIAIGEETAAMFAAGDVIGAFDNNGLCMGMAQVDGHATALVVYGDDMSTSETDGMSDGEMMTLKVYRPSEDKVMDLTVTFNTDMPNSDGLFVSNGISELKMTTSINDNEQLIGFNAYPNPTNGILNLSIASTASGPIQVEILNMLGSVVYQTETFENSHITLDVSDQPDGVYFIRVYSDEGSSMEKLVIQK